MAGDNKVSRSFVISLMLAMIITGACNTLVYKWQNSEEPWDPYEKTKVKFNHPFMQAVAMFVGESTSWLAFFVVIFKNKSDYQKSIEQGLKENKTNSKIKYLYMAIPAFCDFLTSTLQYFALNYIAPSIYQMVRGGVILITALFTIVFLKRKLQRHHGIGCLLVFIGVGLVGVANFAFPGNKSSSQSSTQLQIIAICLIVISLFFNGALFVSEEKLFQKFIIHPMEIVGTEGCWGIGYYAILLPIISTVPCPLGKSVCLEWKGKSRIESPGEYFYQAGHDGWLLVAVIFGILTIAVYNICGVTITKNVSALARSVIDAVRTVIVWGFGIILTATTSSDQWHWENLKYQAIIIELFGFIMLVCGNLIYNEIIKLKFLEKPQGTVSEGENQKNESQTKENLLSMEERNNHEKDQ